MNNLLKNFRTGTFNVICKANQAIYLPYFSGSTLRGGFGHAFKRVTCALRTQVCFDCLLKEKCAYSYVFETPIPLSSTKMKKYEYAPHPYVFSPPDSEKNTFEPGENFEFSFTLIGRAIEYLPYFIYALDVLGELGLGKGKGSFTLKRVESECGVLVFDSEEKKLREPPNSFDYAGRLALFNGRDKITLDFLTPARLKYEESLVTNMEFHVFYRNLVRRISTLSYFHCGEELDIDFKATIEESKKIKTAANNLKWHDWERYSSRQDTRMKLGGLKGRVTYTGDLKPFMPFLVIGEKVHVGKATGFGLGKYKLLMEDSR